MNHGSQSGALGPGRGAQPRALLLPVDGPAGLSPALLRGTLVSGQPWPAGSPPVNGRSL